VDTVEYLRAVLLTPQEAAELDAPGQKDAAVLVPLYVDAAGELHAVFTKRREDLRRHAGEISFPGGRQDDPDEDLRFTALREAEEEIGLPRAQVEVVGVADCYRTVTGFEVTPVVGIVPPDLPLTPHPGEVAALFEAPLHYLLDPAHQQERTAQWRGRERHYYEIEWEGRRIWGATAAMIVNLSRRLAMGSDAS
jgi:8-oxo-dGTP pyrophosphatase MutT (NUDIX family)